MKQHIKKIAAAVILSVAAFFAVNHSSFAPTFAALPPPTGTGLVTVTAGKQDAVALAGTDAGQVPQWTGSAWAAGTAGGGGSVQLLSFAGLGAADGSNWSAGNWSAGHSFTSTDQAVSATGVRFWAKWAGGGTVTLKARLCQCTSSGCSSATSIATATASVAGSGQIATISFSASQAITPGVKYIASIYDTTATNYAKLPCPTSMGGSGGACDGNDFQRPFFASSSHTSAWVGENWFVAGDACPGSGGYPPFQSEFYAVEPVLQ